MNPLKPVPVALLFLFLLLAVLPATAQRLGIVGKPAPSWDDVTWLNLAEDMQGLDVEQLRGRVVYLFLFQSWCPGCHSHGFPTLQETAAEFEGEDVVFLAVQTVFEGFGSNTESRALDEVEDYGLVIPVGHTAGDGDGLPPLMRRYRSGGTPWTVLIDPSGTVRWNGFQLEPQAASRAIRALLQSPSP